MGYIKFLKSYYAIVVLLFFFPVNAGSQTYWFRHYGTENHLPDNFIYTLSQDNSGYLWIGTAAGLTRFDGFEFTSVVFPDSVRGRNTTTSCRDKNGTLWFGCSDGTVFYTSENSLHQLSLLNYGSITRIIEGNDGYIYIIPKEKSIFRINKLKTNEIQRLSLNSNLSFFSACLAGDDKILLGTEENILLCRIGDDSLSISDVIEGVDYTPVQDIVATAGDSQYIIGTEGNGIFKLEISGNENTLSRFENFQDLQTLRVQSFFKDDDGVIWISAFESGIAQLKLSENGREIRSVNYINRNSGLKGNDIKLVFKDFGGNYWIGFFGDGLALFTSYAYSFYAPADTPERNNILYINRYEKGYLLGTSSGYHIFNPISGKTESFVDLNNLAGRKSISAYYYDEKGDLFFGTPGNGVFRKNKNGSVQQFFRSGDSGEDNIVHITSDKQYLWLSTLNGLLIIDRSTGALKKKFNITTGLPHNSIKQVSLGKDGNGYVAIESEKLYYVDPELNLNSIGGVMSGNYLNRVSSITQSKDGAVWAATIGNGIFRCTDDSVTSVNASKGLLSNYCYSIFADEEDIIWIGHDRGMSRYNPATGIIKVLGTGFAQGGKSNPDAIYESDDRKVFIGTSDGFIIYDRYKEKKKPAAPFNNINSITINDIKYPYQPSFSLPYSKRYLVRINYVGIDFGDPEKVYYSTFLENWDNDWSDMNLSREVTYPLSTGRYKFNLISVNEEGLSQDTPVTFSINVQKPFWKTWWFTILSLAAAIGSVILIITIREKKQKKIKEYLESELAARTKVVLKQKEEIELQNIEITDSINYAKRIQSSILPDIHKLRESLPESFIFLQPRDIVSGDFYWFDKTEEDKLILVCADSTGHGVPGAFMSMIGSTLLQDIVARKRIFTPSRILKMLDKQIFSTLNQNEDIGVANDGMDMVICEVDVKNRHIKFASAMRPVIIVMDGESNYIRGNRSSVGGEAVNEKHFDDQEYYLGKGDTVYFFSDGLPDQFGGSDGKKMKIARLKSFMQELSTHPMSEQHDAVTRFYSEWKGDLEQVDDILVMGFKL
jgi:ligand-binding sensor domain-containing protein/serine phosphatase RsbU (regulator of sigma subunit)